jgi:hypothetical protein
MDVLCPAKSRLRSMDSSRLLKLCAAAGLSAGLLGQAGAADVTGR